MGNKISKEFETLLRLESERSGWGILLIYREEFFEFIRPYKRILDVGCHRQLLKRTILERYPDKEVIGIDVVDYGNESPDYICSVEDMPFEDEFFDCISMIETLEHVQDVYCALKECNRVLKPSGGMYIQSVAGGDPCAEGDPTHFHAFTHWSLYRLLRLFFQKVSVERRGGTLVAKVRK